MVPWAGPEELRPMDQSSRRFCCGNSAWAVVSWEEVILDKSASHEEVLRSVTEKLEMLSCTSGLCGCR